MVGIFEHATTLWVKAAFNILHYASFMAKKKDSDNISVSVSNLTLIMTQFNLNLYFLHLYLNIFLGGTTWTWFWPHDIFHFIVIIIIIDLFIVMGICHMFFGHVVQLLSCVLWKITSTNQDELSPSKSCGQEKKSNWVKNSPSLSFSQTTGSILQCGAVKERKKQQQTAPVFARLPARAEKTSTQIECCVQQLSMTDGASGPVFKTLSATGAASLCGRARCTSTDVPICVA